MGNKKSSELGSKYIDEYWKDYDRYNKGHLEIEEAKLFAKSLLKSLKLRTTKKIEKGKLEN